MIEELTGRTLGDFVVRHRIGEGGFGAVYRAEQPLLGREAVVKVLHGRHRSSKTVIQRFLREARLASKLDHPYAAHIYAFGVESDNLMWIAMEYVRGKTLADLLRERGPMSLEELVPLLDRICEVLQTAHELGIVHRDIKPPNVMVVQRSGRTFPKLLDFGVAKLAGGETDAEAETALAPVEALAASVASRSSAGDKTPRLDKTEPQHGDNTMSFVGPPGGAIAQQQVGGFAATIENPPRAPTSNDEVVLTEAGAAVGSPPYMAPEQWEDSSAATARTDLYALGIMTYETLTGRRPFVAQTMMGYAMSHAATAVPPLRGTFPAALDAVMQKVLAKQPDDRYASALEFAHAFRAAAGFGTQPLPTLDDDLRVSVETSFPQPIAEAVAAFHAARNPHQGRDALLEIATTAIRYIAMLALAAHAQVLVDSGDASAIAELVRELRRRALPDADWLKLARLLVAPFRTRHQAHAMPELVAVLAADTDDVFAALVEDRTEAEPLIAIRERLPAITRMLRSLAFLADYPLVVVADDRAESWMGVRRPRRSALEIHGRSVEPGQPAIIDGSGRPTLALWPIAQTSAPMPGAAPELFMLDGPGRRGARLVALPHALERQDERVWEWLAERFAKDDPDRALDSTSGTARPYRGLSTFTLEDAEAFVGREREVDAAINRLRTSSLVAVVGPSGAGKSSFVHAGVVPSLPESWTTVTLRPGPTPLATLQARLAGVTAQATVLVIDQFEELFTLGAPAEERRAFVQALLGATRDGAVRVVLTLRDDFLGRATQMAELRDALPAALFLLGTPARPDLIRILRQPLERLGFDFDDATLPERMVDEVADTPGALALLSFTAAQLWELRDRHFRQLTRKAYDALGGVAGALAQHAEITLAELSPNQQRLARTALVHLVTAEGTRAVLARKELDQLLRDPGADAVIEKLVGARLLVATEAEGGEDRIELVHEALLSAWPRLAEWRRESAEGARLRDQVRAIARQWVERDKPRGLLWRDDALAELQVWRTRHPQPLTDADEAFVQASFGDAKRRQRWRRGLVAFALAATAVFVVVLWRATVSARDSARIADHASADVKLKLRESLFEEGRLLMVAGDKLGALAPLEKAQSMGDSAALRFMIAEAKRTTEARILTLKGHTAKVWDVAFASDGTRVATASGDGSVRLWDATTGRQVAAYDNRTTTSRVALSPDGTLIAAVGRTIRVWRIADGREVASISLPGSSETLAFDPSGSMLVGTTLNGELVELDVATGTSTELEGHTGKIGAAYCANGSCLVTWDETGRVAVRDLRGAEKTHYDVHVDSAVTDGAIDATGSLVALGTRKGELVLLAGGKVIEVAHAHDQLISSIVFSPNGETIATASSDRDARLWTRRGALIATLSGHRAALDHIRFSPDGTLVATASDDGTVRLWSAATGLVLGELAGHHATILRLAFSPDGTRLAIASSDHEASVWDVAPAQQFHPLPAAFIDTTQEDHYLQFSPAAGDTYAMLAPDRTLHVAGIDGRIRCRFELPHVQRFAWSDDGNVIAAVDETPLVHLWDARTCTAMPVLAHPADVWAIAFTPNNDLVTGGRDRVLRRWQLRDVRVIAEVRVDKVAITNDGGISAVYVAGGRVFATTLTFGPVYHVVMADLDLRNAPKVFDAGQPRITSVLWDGAHQRVMASSFDQNVWVWDAASGARLAKLEGSGPLWRVVADASGRILALGGTTPTIWDGARFEKRHDLEGHTDFVVAGDLVADGLLVTVSRDHSARVWDLETGKALLVIQGAQALAVDRHAASIILADDLGARSWSMR